MANIASTLGNDNNWWIPIIIFLSLTSIYGFLIYKNSKVREFVIRLNIISFAISFSIFTIINISLLLIPKLSDDKSMENIIALARPIMLPILHFFISAISYLFVLIVKLIRMKPTTTKQNSFWSSKGFGVITSVPIIATFTATSGMLTTSNVFTKTIGVVNSSASIGQLRAVGDGETISNLFMIVNMVIDKDYEEISMVIDSIHNNVDPDNLETVSDVIEKHKTFFEKIFNDDYLMENLWPKIIDVMNEDVSLELDITNPEFDLLSTIYKDVKFNVSNKNIGHIYSNMKKMVTFTNGDDEATKEQVDEYWNNIRSIIFE